MEINLNFEAKYYESKTLTKLTNNCNNASLETNDSKIFNYLDNLLDLGDPKSFNWLKLNKNEIEKFGKILSKLVRNGIIGYRYYEINGQLERHFIEYEMANPRFANAKIKYIDKKQYSIDFLV